MAQVSMVTPTVFRGTIAAPSGASYHVKPGQIISVDQNDELFLLNLGFTAAAPSTATSGGDVVGPSGATNGHLAVFDGATGKLIKDGGAAPVSLAGFTTPTNTALGTGAGAVDLSTSNNVFVGKNAGANTTTAGGSNTGDYNVFVGWNAGATNTTGFRNVFLGAEAGRYNTTGYKNIFIGYQVGKQNTTGRKNIFMGLYAGLYTTTGKGNVFIGYKPGQNNVSGGYNAFFGYKAGYSNTTGFGNAAFGYHSGRFNTSGSYNVFFGHYAGKGNTSGGYNIFIGAYAGQIITTGSQNILIGKSVTAPANSTSNYLNIGNVLKGDMSAGPIEIVKDLQLDTGNLILVGATVTVGTHAGTLTNAPAAGDPTFWVHLTVNGTLAAYPAWAV